MKGKIVKAIIGLGVLLSVCSNYNVNAQSLNDIDGNHYKTIKHGMQEWTANNLNVTRFRNGDLIPEARTKDEWIDLGSKGKPAWCYYDNDSVIGKTLGKLYNWYAINDPRGLAPEGWHIPVNQDWRTLVKNLLGLDVAGLKLKSTTGWKKSGSNKIGFSALPAGFRTEKADFKGLGSKAQWWSNSEPVDVIKSDQIYSLMLNDFTMEVSYLKMEKGAGLSVRCLKDIMPLKVSAADSLSSF